MWKQDLRKISLRALADLCFFVRDSKKDKAGQEKERHQSHGNVDGAAREFYPGDDGGAEKGGAFGKNIIDSEVFPGIFCRNDLGKIASGQGLNGSLEHAYAQGHEAELNQCAQCQGIEAHTEIANDACGKQSYRAVPL